MPVPVLHIGSRLKAFVEGVGSVFNLAPIDVTHKTPIKSDREAMEENFRTMGNDFWAAYRVMEHWAEHSRKTG